VAGLEIEDLYKDECPHCFELGLNEFINSDYLSSVTVLSDVIRDFKSGNSDVVNDKLFNLYNDNLQKGIRGVFKADSKNYKELDYLYKFDANAAKFSAYKANYVGSVLRKALEADPKEFDLNAKRILNTFNRFQVTEYNTTVARCRTAKQFDNFLSLSKVSGYNNLEWLMTRSAAPRELHLKIVGTVLPIVHPFWRYNQPGNLYNCKCDWKLTNAPVTTAPDNVVPAKGLEKNPAISREIFTGDHPYYRKAKSTDQINEFLFKHVLKQFEKRGGYFIHPLVLSKKFKSASKAETIRIEKETEDLLLVAKRYTELGKTVYVLPDIYADSDLYKYMFKSRGSIGNSCADLLIDGELIEYEAYEKASKDSVINMLSSGARQCEKIIINTRGLKVTNHYVMTQINALKRDKHKITEVWILTDDGVKQIL